MSRNLALGNEGYQRINADNEDDSLKMIGANRFGPDNFEETEKYEK